MTIIRHTYILACTIPSMHGVLVRMWLSEDSTWTENPTQARVFSAEEREEWDSMGVRPEAARWQIRA